MITGIIFDMDGVIFDTERLALDAWTYAGGQTGAGITPALVLATVGLDLAHTRQIFEESLGAELDFDALQVQRILYTKRYIEEHGVPQKPGFAELLEYLKLHRYKTALATSSQSDRARGFLEQAGLWDSFDVIVCRDDIAVPKPAPDIYLKAAERLGVSPEDCLALEDSPSGVLSAFRAGMRVVMIPDLVAPDEETGQYLYGQVAALTDVILLLSACEREA